MIRVLVLFLIALAAHAQAAPATQVIFTGRMTTGTVALTNNGQMSHALVVTFPSTTAVTDFVIRVEGSFDAGATWIPITADLTSAVSNGTTAAAIVRGSAVYPRLRANYVTASAKAISAYYYGTATSSIDGFVFAGGNSAGAAAVAIATALSAGTVKPAASDFDILPDGTTTIHNRAVFPLTSGLLCYDATAPIATALSTASGTTCPTPSTLTTAVSPATLSIAQGNAATSTLTFTASGLSAGIVPACTGLPTGVTTTFATNPVAAAGGSTVATFTASLSATVGTATISCGGTSGAKTATPASIALTVSLAPAAMLSVTSVTVPSSGLNLTTGAIDWAANADRLSYGQLGYRVGKTGGTAIDRTINSPGINTDQSQPSTSCQPQTWSDASDATTSGTTCVDNSTHGTSTSISFITLPDTATHTVTVVMGYTGNAVAINLTAHLSSGTASDAIATYTPAAGNGGNPLPFVVVFSVKDTNPTGNPLALTFASAWPNDSVFIQAIKLQ